MKFDPNSTNSFVLLKAGKCKFKVIEVGESTNQFGDSFNLTLKLKDSTENKTEGQVKNVWVNSSNINDFLIAIKKPELFKTGNVSPKDIINKVGDCVVGHQDFYSNTTGKLLTGLYVHTFLDIDIVPPHLPAKDAGQDSAVAKQKQGEAQTYSNAKQGEQGKQSVQEFDDDVPF